MPDAGFAELAGKVDNLARALSGDALKRVVTRVALAAKGDVRDEAADELGPDRRMSGWTRIRFDAGYDVTGPTTAEVTPRPAGPWAVLNFGRRAKASGLPRRKRAKVYRTPWGLRTATPAHPFRQGATRGHYTWTRAVHRIAEQTPRRVQAEERAALARVFGPGSG